MADACLDQVVLAATGLERFPKMAPSGIKRHHHAIRGDHQQAI